MMSCSLAGFLTIVISALAGLVAADDCGGTAIFTKCETMRAGEDGKSCQFAKPKKVCLKEGEWTKAVDESDKGQTRNMYRAIGCKAGGKGVAAQAPDETMFKNHAAPEYGLKTESKADDKPCATWPCAKMAEAATVLTKAINAACKSSEDKLGSSKCSEILYASEQLAKLL